MLTYLLKLSLKCFTSFQRHKFPQTKMHTDSNIIFGHSFLHDVIHFVPRVSSKNLEIEVSIWLAVEELQAMRKWFLDLTLRTKWITPCERAWNTVPQNGVASCVHFGLRSLVPFERCEGEQGKKVCKTTAVQFYQCFSLRSLLFLASRAKWLIPNNNKKLQWWVVNSGGSL